MTSPWDKNRVNMRFNKQQQEMLEDEDFKNYLKEKYDGFTDFVTRKMREEKNQAPSLEERIQQKQEKVEELVEDLDELKEKRRREQDQERLREKKKELRSVQQKIRDIQNSDLLSEQEIRREETEKRRERGHNPEDEKVAEAIESAVERRLKKQPSEEDLLELKKKATRLQEEVMELNGGESYDWFLDPQEAVEVEA